MKMEHEVSCDHDGTVAEALVGPGDTVAEGAPLLVVEVGRADPAPPDAAPPPATPSSDDPRPALRAVLERHRLGLDAARPEAVAKRHARGRRTARENLEDLLDPGSFVEYGALLYAAQETRRPKQELIERTPADGLVAGTGTVGRRPVLALSYDYTVLAGTQGWRNHAKKDRLFELAR